MKVLNARWKEMSPEAKAPYEAKAIEAAAQYEVLKQAYEAVNGSVEDYFERKKITGYNLWKREHPDNGPDPRP